MVSQKVTKGDRGEGGSGLFSKALMTSFLDGPLSQVIQTLKLSFSECFIFGHNRACIASSLLLVTSIKEIIEI